MHVTVAECSQGKSEDMLTRRGRDTGTNDLDGTEQPYNPAREDGSVFLTFLSATPGEGETGCRDGVPAGGLGAKPLRSFLCKKVFFTVGGFSINIYISNIVYIVSSFSGRNPLFSRVCRHEKTHI